MSNRSVRVDDAVLMLSGDIKIIHPKDEDKVETMTVSLPGFIFSDGKPRKRNIEVGPFGRKAMDSFIASLRRTASPLIEFLTEHNPEAPAEEDAEDTDKDTEEEPADATEEEPTGDSTTSGGFSSMSD